VSSGGDRTADLQLRPPRADAPDEPSAAEENEPRPEMPKYMNLSSFDPHMHMTIPADAGAAVPGTVVHGRGWRDGAETQAKTATTPVLMA